jgi:hypothetical protein
MYQRCCKKIAGYSQWDVKSFLRWNRGRLVVLKGTRASQQMCNQETRPPTDFKQFFGQCVPLGLLDILELYGAPSILFN